MQRSLTSLGLIASVGLLIAVFVFALKNPELFIDDLSNSYSQSTLAGSNESTLKGAKISGAVVGSQETQVRESAKIQDAELDALQNEQWLQQTDSTVDENSSVDSVLEFAPERPLELEKSFESEQKSNKEDTTELVNNTNALSSVDNKGIEKELTQKALQDLNNMSFVDIRFQFGQLTLSNKALQKIQSVAIVLKKNPSINAKINNYTDSYGDDNFNLELSRQRANTVYQAFLDKGVDQQQLSFEGLGESNPVTSNATLAGRKKNRRTEIQFFEAK